MEYADKLQNELKEAHETIGALRNCLERLLDGENSPVFLYTCRQIINESRAKKADK